MEIRQIYYVLEVAKQRNFSKAAEALYITQPTISHQIQGIEKEFGIQIFERDTHGVSLTEDGERFCRYAWKVVGAIDEMMDAFDQGTMASKAVLHVGVFTFYKSTRLAGIIRDYFADNANVIGSTRVTENYQAYELLRAGELEFAVLKLRPYYRRGEFVYEKLEEDRLSVLVQRSHPLAQAATCPVAALSGVPLVGSDKKGHYYQEIKRMYEENALEFRVSFATDDSDNILEMVASGVGVNLMTLAVGSQIQDERMVAIPIEPPQEVNTYLVYPKGKRLKGAELGFRNYIRDAYAEESISE